MRKILFLLTIIAALPSFSQHFESGHIFPSNYKDSDGNKIGKSSMQYISGSYTLPIKSTIDSIKGINMWSATFTGKYATLDNKNTATYTPREIINAGAMLTHVSSISTRWNIIATAGVSLNAVPSYIRLQSIAVTAGIIFMYNINRNLNIGIGAVATTAYGEPVIIPAPFITWKKEGKYNIELNMRGIPELTISTQPSKATTLTFSPLKTDRYSAVVNINGKHYLYTQSILKSTLGASYSFSKHWSAEANVGYIYHHTAHLQERSFKAFWDEMFDHDSRNKFSPSATISIGLKYHIR